MSWYTNYYLCVKNEDGKYMPYGAFVEGTPMCLMTRSRSFEYGISEMMQRIEPNELSKEFIDHFFEGNLDEANQYGFVSAMPVKDLPNSKILNSGYVPVEELNELLSDEEMLWNGDLRLGAFEGFSEIIQPDVFSLMLSNPARDNEKLSKYVFYAWIQDGTKEFQTYELREIIEAVEDNVSWDNPYKKATKYLICIEG